MQEQIELEIEPAEKDEKQELVEKILRDRSLRTAAIVFLVFGVTLLAMT